MDPVNPGPSTSGMSPPKKRRRLDLGHLSVGEKQCIVNMYKDFNTDVPDVPKMGALAIVNKIAITAGIAKSTVYRVLKEYKETGNVTESQHSGGRPNLMNMYNDYTTNSVRRIVHSFFYKNEMPTVDKILNEIQNREDLPQMSCSSLYTFMKKINFKFVKRNRKSVLTERDDIIRWRRTYLRTMKQFRAEGRIIYYLDETWVNEGHTKEKVWADTSIQSKRQAFVEGLSTGLKNPSGKGKRLIILHVGSEFGFVDEALLLFEGKKTADYHEEMNSQVFEEWFSKFLLKIPDNSVIVMDNASYHSRKLEKIPTSSSRKSVMQEWLKSKNINFDTDMVRSELLHLIQLHRSNYDSYVIDEMAKKSNKVVLRLPPYHCELNPIELIWAKLKNEVASKNTTFKMKDVQQLFLQAVKNITSTDWQNCITHAIKEEEKMSKLDGLMDILVEPLIISLGDDSETTSTDSEDN